MMNEQDIDTTVNPKPISRFSRMMNSIHRQSLATLIIFFVLALGFAMQFNSEQVIAEQNVTQYALLSALDFMSTEFIIFYSLLVITAIVLFKKLGR
ncbi:hypothetical protein SIN8267_02469 [Sinobacterium norvegicum]|uniref:Uncharacterized protein n=1 Tax=Sinobacterium norvegicum TaxID=1641715 RepID=A0ABM9AGL5_9GAMM|nr:hypothetical protein [Sinobacterium norvegicum]CAH0992350.1 hypothetical protein SIN8267_02469 [Sinobacterium norvegicum]